MDITSPLRDFFQEMKESLSQVTSLCQSIRQINEQGVSIFAQVQRYFRKLISPNLTLPFI